MSGKKNKTAADIYREEMSDATQPKSVVEGSRPLDNIKITPEEDESIVPTGGGAFDPSKWGISTDTDNTGTIKTNRAAATIVDNDESEDNDPLKFFTDMANNLWTKEDEEAAAKKQKAAQWITAAQMLGDSIGALSNVYWTGKGANAMKFEPGAQKAAAATYQLEQDIRNAREKAAKAQYNAALKKLELEMQREREKKYDERYEATQAENKRRYDDGVAYRRERDAIVDAREKELMEFRRQQENRIAKSSQGASTSTKYVEPIEFTLGDGETIGIDKFNKDKLNILYRSLPEDVRYAVENEEVYSDGLPIGTKKRKVTDDDRLQAIYENLDNPEVANAIRRLAGVKGVKKTNDELGTGGGRGASAAPSNVQTGQGKDGRIKVDLSKL